MAVRSWLQKNQVFDRDLVVLFPKYGVNNPENDLKQLSTEAWNELKLRLMTDRAAELKDSAARNRMQKKLTKIEKLWKSTRNNTAKQTKKKSGITTIEKPKLKKNNKTNNQKDEKNTFKIKY
eukprot:901438_1